MKNFIIYTSMAYSLFMMILSQHYIYWMFAFWGITGMLAMMDLDYLQLFEKKIIERDKDVPYLVRWNILGIGKDSKWFSIKLHHILISDLECLHDHPWWYISAILKGGYYEVSQADIGRPDQQWKNLIKSDQVCRSKWFGPGRILIRPAQWAHQLVIPEGKTCWTLVFTFKKIRNWGFYTRSGWKAWFKFSHETNC